MGATLEILRPRMATMSLRRRSSNPTPCSATTPTRPTRGSP